MIVVLDTSCISAFVLADCVDVLLKILEKQRIVITEQVARELKLSKNENLRNFSHRKIDIKNAKSDIASKYPIHIGEASVIMLAKETGALAVIDDKKAREAAQKEGVDFIGTATLLKIGVEKGILRRDEAGKLIDAITTAGKLYLSGEIRAWILE